MKKNHSLLLSFVALVALTATGTAQTRYRRAAFVGASDPSEGRCTVSVLVDGAADVEIRGDSAALRTITGPPPQWQRFECTGPLPYSPADLRIRAIEGNGRMTLTHDSSNGNVAVVRINNYDPGDQLYTFDVYWRPQQRVYTSSDADRLVVEDDDSIQSCRTAAESRIRNDGFRDVRFRSISKDTRGSNDLITGTATANRPYGSEQFSFSCRVDPADGLVRRLDVTRR
jgi:hypothetical protein